MWNRATARWWPIDARFVASTWLSLNSVACLPSSIEFAPGALRSVATTTAPADPSVLAAPCLTQELASAVRQQHERIVDAATAAATHAVTSTFIPAASTCEKLIYLRGEYRIVVQRLPDGRLQARHRVWPTVTPTVACLDNALTKTTLLWPVADRFFGAAQQAIGERWTDPDLGPLAWVECISSTEASDVSIGPLVHELNHALSVGRHCTYEPTTAQQRCFDFRLPLPPRSLARLAPTELSRGARTYASPVVQAYLIADDSGPGALFDELTSYRLETEIATAQVRAKQRRAVPTAQGRLVQLTYLPLFLLYSARYAVNLAATDASVFQQTFARGSHNRTLLLALLDQGAAAYRAWTAALLRVGEAPEPVETECWNAYLSTRRALDRLPTARDTSY